LSVNDPSLSNQDSRPTTPAQRTWTMYNYIALWFSMSMEITTLPAGIPRSSPREWIGTGCRHGAPSNLIVLVPMLLNAHAGAKYGIPFPVFIRAAVRRARRQPARDSPRHWWLALVRHSVMDSANGDSSHYAGGHLAVSRRSSGRALGMPFLGFWLLNDDRRLARR